MIGKDLISYDPLDRFFDIRDDFDNAMKNFLRGFGGPVSSRGVFPLADIKEDEDKYTVTLETPGIDKKDLKITMKDNSLLVEGEKKEEEKKEEKESYLRVERSYGNFRRVFNFGSKLDSKKVNADFKDGILTVTLPKTEKEKPKEIEVKVK
jgi:HSP20 family protein